MEYKDVTVPIVTFLALVPALYVYNRGNRNGRVPIITTNHLIDGELAAGLYALLETDNMTLTTATNQINPNDNRPMSFITNQSLVRNSSRTKLSNCHVIRIPNAIAIVMNAS